MSGTIAQFRELRDAWSSEILQGQALIARAPLGELELGAPLGASAGASSADAPADLSLWDGEKTTRIMAERLAQTLQALIARRGPGAWADIERRMQRALNTLIGLLGAQQPHAGRPPLALSPSPLHSDLQRRLLRQALPCADDHALTVVVPAETADYSLTCMGALWRAGGPLREIDSDRLAPFWDAQGRLSLDRPYVLHISGAADQSDLAPLSHALAGVQAPLIVLANAVQKRWRDWLKGRPYVELPAPQLSEQLIAAPRVAHGTGWTLSRWRAAQIDAQQAVLVSPRGVLPDRSEQSTADGTWHVRQALVLQVPEAARLPESAAARALNWRIDAEHGLAADGGAALAWLAAQLDAAADPLVRVWQVALYAPLRQILANLVRGEREQEIIAWVTQGDGPWRAYLVSPEQEGAQAAPIRLGTYQELGSVVPLRQIERMLRHAWGTARKQLSIESLAALAALDSAGAPGQLAGALRGGMEAAGTIWNLAFQEGRAQLGRLQALVPQRRISMAPPQAEGRRPVPAAGLYYYTEDRGQLKEHVIGFDGAPKPSGKVYPVGQIPTRRVHVDQQIPQGNWVLEIPGAPVAYLTMLPLGQERPPVILLDPRTRPAISTNRHYSIPPQLRASLAYMLRYRREYGYLKVPRNAAEVALRRNAEPFWDTLRIVSEKLVAAITQDLQAGPGARTYFTNPDLVFHLNRVLSEGFIDGHADADRRFKLTAMYEHRADSVRAWKQAITYAGREEIAYAALRPEEQEIFAMLWESTFSSELPRHMLKIEPLLHLISFITPGIGQGQNIVFWAMHYPHWKKDLVYALRELAAQQLYLGQADLDRIAQIIVESLAETERDHLAASAGRLTQRIKLPTVTNLMRRLAREAGADRGALDPAVRLWQRWLGRAADLLSRWLAAILSAWRGPQPALSADGQGGEER